MEKEGKNTTVGVKRKRGRAEIIALPCETSRGYNTASGELGCAYSKYVFQREVILGKFALKVLFSS